MGGTLTPRKRKRRNNKKRRARKLRSYLPAVRAASRDFERAAALFEDAIVVLDRVEVGLSALGARLA